MCYDNNSKIVRQRRKETLDLWKQFEEGKYDDCQHIATAVVHGCDCIISWNFKHIVNIKTIKGVRAITHLESYKDIDIMNPSVLLGGEE